MAKATRQDRPDGRKYFDGEGNEYWSVTTLLSGGVPKQNLIPWAAAQASHSMVEELAIPSQATRQVFTMRVSGAWDVMLSSLALMRPSYDQTAQAGQGCAV